MSSPAALDVIVADFDLLDDWEDKYRYIIELGRRLPPFPEAQRTPDNAVSGCASQVWLAAEPAKQGGNMRFFADSDAHIVRGLLALLLAAYNDRASAQILAFDLEALFARIGLTSHLSNQRANGVRAVAQAIRRRAAS